MQDFVYAGQVEEFMQIVILGFVLSVPVCYFVQSIKSAGGGSGKLYFVSSVLASVFFGMLFSIGFTDMDIYESVCLVVMLWLSSQGFYEYLKGSDSWIGRRFISLSGSSPEIDDEDSGKEGERGNDDDENGEEMIFPVNYVGISTAFSRSHPAVDFGYSDEYGGKNQPVIAPCDMKVVFSGESRNIGKYIISHAKYSGEKYTFRFIHLSEISVKKGDMIGKGEKIGKMGNTGTECFGYHLHFDIWKGHTGDISSSSGRYEKSVDALKLCRLGKSQKVGDVTDIKYEIIRGEYADSE